jgi:hypothetical protein
MTDTPKADLTKLTGLYGLIPSNAQTVPKCAICGTADAPNVAHGELPDKSLAGFIPVCEPCFQAHKAPPPAQGGKK